MMIPRGWQYIIRKKALAMPAAVFDFNDIKSKLPVLFRGLRQDMKLDGVVIEAPATSLNSLF
jgi:hypothetical protein